MEIMFLFVGLLFAGLGIYLVWEHARFSTTARPVPGKVIAIEKRTTPENKDRESGGPIYYPVIEYLADGKIHTFTSGLGMSLPQYEIGESIPLLHSSKYSEGRIRNSARYIFGGIFFAVGIGLCILFFNIFQISVWSVGVSALVIVGLLFSAKKKLQQHDISTLDELKEAFRNTDMKTSKGTEPEQKEVFSEQHKINTELYRESSSLKWISPLMTFIGISVIALGIFLGKQRAQFLDVASSSEGEVISLNSKSSDDSYTYYPVVRFTPAETSRAIIFEHDMGSNPPSYQVGEKVAVLYHPNDHQIAIIDAGLMNWFGPGMALILGIVFFIGGLYSWHHRSKLKRAIQR